MADIFLSYSSSDRTQAKSLAEELERPGWSVWWDRQVPIGGVWSDVIEQELGRSRAVVVLWSGDSVRSDWVKNEARAANARRILMPALIAQTILPIEFQHLQTADLTNWEPGAEHTEFDKLVDGLTRLLECSVAPAEGALPQGALAATSVKEGVASTASAPGAHRSVVRRALLLYEPSNALGWFVRLAFYLSLAVAVAVPIFPDDVEMSLSDRVITVLFWGIWAAFMSWCGSLIEHIHGQPIVRPWVRRFGLLYWPRQRAARLVHLVFYTLASLSAGGLIFLTSEWLADPQLTGDTDFVGVLASMGIPGAFAALTRGVARRLDTKP